MDCAIRSAYRFMRDHAGYVVGRRAEGALALARAERLLGEAIELGVASVDWQYDDVPYDHCAYTDEQVRQFFESNTWTGPFGCTVTAGDEIASLWGIVVGPRETNDPYCRVVQAELADELTDALRQAIGDAKDARQRVCV